MSGSGSSREAELEALLTAADFEVIPLRGALERARALPTGSVVTVTASPSRGLQATVDLAVELRQAGYEAVPHLAARMITDRAHLTRIVETLRGNGVDRAFVIGGDPEPSGIYEDAGSLLRDIVDLGHQFDDVGIAGYPEGHPGISDERLGQVLREKAAMADYVVTQMCFQSSVILEWVRRIRSDGIQLPVRVGVPGSVDLVHLLPIAGRIGVGESMRVLTKNRGLLRLIRPGRYTADEVIEGVAAAEDGPVVDGLHLFTFNQVAATLAWRDQWLARLG